MSAAFGEPGRGVGLAARVILHLASLPRLGINDVAAAGYTQAGMVSALSVHQASLVHVLQRLLAGDVVTVERRFVTPASRRMKVYRLTAVGESAARDLLHPRVAPPAVAPTDRWTAVTPSAVPSVDGGRPDA